MDENPYSAPQKQQLLPHQSSALPRVAASLVSAQLLIVALTALCKVFQNAGDFDTSPYGVLAAYLFLGFLVLWPISGVLVVLCKSDKPTELPRRTYVATGALGILWLLSAGALVSFLFP
jgi:hypothetical protein